MSNITRRNFIKSASLASNAILFSPSSNFASETKLQPPTLKIRKDIGTLAIDDPIILSYKKAVQAMKNLPSTDPRNWENQARIHLNHCPHGNWFFLPWHRAYLRYFEKICAQLSENPNFALPYWNWTKDTQIPAAFFGNGNTLNDSTRQRGPNDTVDAEFVGASAIGNILAIPDFITFASNKSTIQRANTGQGQLESTPHNYIHRFVNGNMASLMSPLDPLFWLHHANIDRLWVEWNEAGHTNSLDPIWLNFNFSNNFYDISSSSLASSVFVRSLLNTTTLNYRYDTQNTSPFIAGSNNSNFITQPNFKLSKENNKALDGNSVLEIALESSAQFNAKVNAVSQPEVNNEILKININDVKISNDEDFAVRVFLNCEYLSQDTPIEDPHYVASITFFGTQHNHNGNDHTSSTLNFVLDATPTLERLKRNKKLIGLENGYIVGFTKISLKNANVSNQFLPKIVNVSLSKKS